MKNKALVILAAVFLFVGCGGGSTTSKDLNTQGTNTPGTNTPGSNSVQTGTGTYVDAAINGVRYECGSKTGITGDSGVSGSFTFEVGKDCIFKINNIGLTAIAAANLREGVEVKPNLEVARYLQSLDSDGNPNNGIEIEAAVVKALADKGIIGLQQTDTQVRDMVNALRDVDVYHGSYRSMQEAEDHLFRFSVQIAADKNSYNEGDTVTFTANVTGSNAGLTYEWKERGITLGTSPQLVDSNFNSGSHTVNLTVTNSDNEIVTDSITITVGSGSSYDHTVSISPISANYSPDQFVTLNAVVSGAVGTVTYLWKDGLDTIGNSSTLRKKFAVGSHTVTVSASANNLTKNASVAFNVSDSSNTDLVANAGSDVTINARSYYYFNGSKSSSGNPDRTIVKYEWIDSNGIVLNSRTSYYVFAKQFSNPGDYTITLRVTDNEGATAEDTIVVHVL